MVGSFPAEAQEEVWSKDRDAVMSASFEPRGVAKRVEGGFRFSGRHGFASGIDHADWLICGGFIVDGEVRDGPHFFLIRKSEASVIDDWYTVGLEGTGSKSFSVGDVFIPAHRMLDGARARAGDPPGAAVNSAAVYRLPRGGLTPTVFAALTVGMARGVLEEWLRYTAARTSRGTAVGAQPGSQLIAGEASAEIAAAEALYLGTIRDGMRRLAAGERLSETDLMIAKRNAAFACRLSIAAGTRLFNAAGGRAIFRSNALQRQYRNMLAGAAHFSVTWDTNAMAAGKALLEEAGKRE
jgi:3-hydroxy-9,10-secoandrosta-1,3,5(10)-triene-9,17-dione monooxygenase